VCFALKGFGEFVIQWFCDLPLSGFVIVRSPNHPITQSPNQVGGD
jgi:hypothetical protein